MRVQQRDKWNRWYFFSGADHSCLNIRCYHNGATDEDYEKNPDYAERNIDQIHICDIPAFIAELEKARATSEAEEPE